jgi:hypothetical protein
LVSDGDVRRAGLGDAPAEEDWSPKIRSSCSLPSRLSLSAPPTMTSRPRLPKTKSSLPFWTAAGVDPPDRRQERRLDLLEPRVGQVRVDDLLGDRAVVAEDDVVVDRLRAAQDGARALAVDQVAAGIHVVGDERRSGLDRGPVVDEAGRGDRRARAVVDRCRSTARGS